MSELRRIADSCGGVPRTNAAAWGRDSERMEGEMKEGAEGFL